MAILNSTISSNIATTRTGAFLSVASGVGQTAEAVILQTTIANNQQNGSTAVRSRTQFDGVSAVLQIGNTILVANTGGDGNITTFGEGPGVVSLGHNLADDDGDGLLTGNGDQASVAVPAVDLTLRDNGGPTLTHALVQGSNAINGGNNSLAVDPGPDHLVGAGGDDIALTTDQRLTDYDRIVDGTVDIGAFETHRPKVELSDISMPINESGGITGVSIQVETDVPVVGDQTVQLTVAGTGITASDYSVSEMTFTIPDGEKLASVDFMAQPDDIVEGVEIATLTISGPSAGLDLGQQTSRELTINDDDEAGFTLSKTSVSVSEAQTSESFTLVLDKAPLTDVVFNISSDDLTEATVAPATIAFTTSNWDTPQTVTVTGEDDLVEDGDQLSNVTVSIDVANSDDAFDSLADQTVSVTTTDVGEFSFDVDQDQNCLPLTDGILLMRYLAGFTGDALISGAVNETEGQRTAADDIIAWLDSHRSIMDVDGDGSLTPLTDGLLMLRFIAGFTGDSLVAGAVNETGTRTTAAEIETWLGQFKGQSASDRVAAGPIVSAPLAHSDEAEPETLHRIVIADDSTIHRGLSNGGFAARSKWRSRLLPANAVERLTAVPEIEDIDFVFQNALEFWTDTLRAHAV